MRYLVLAAATAASLILVGAAAAMPDSSETPVAAPPPVLVLPPTILTPPPATPATPASPGSGSEGGSGTVTLPTGCRTIDFFAEQKSFLFHVRIYRFHQIKHWCWRNGVVYDERHAWTFEGSATACFDSVYPDNSWFFTWWKNKANSGHFSEERAHVTNCVFHFGDWKEFYPDVKIWAYADGTYTVSTQN